MENGTFKAGGSTMKMFGFVTAGLVTFATVSDARMTTIQQTGMHVTSFCSVESTSSTP
jgi:hypothetical protein